MTKFGYAEVDYETEEDWLTGRFQPLTVGKPHRGSGAADSGIGGSTYSGRGTTATTAGSSGYSLTGTSSQHEVNTTAYNDTV